MDYVKLTIKKVFRYLLKPLSFVPALLVMVMIFRFSSQTGTESSALSTSITETIVHSVNYRLNMEWSPEVQAALVASLEHYVRKCAHFGEYALLGITLVIPLYTYRLRRFLLPLLSEAICIAYALLDEYHQTFSDGRSPQLSDVGIDAAGALAGILIGWLICHILARTIFRPLSMEKERRAKKEYKKRQRARRRKE